MSMKDNRLIKSVNWYPLVVITPKGSNSEKKSLGFLPFSFLMSVAESIICYLRDSLQKFAD